MHVDNARAHEFIRSSVDPVLPNRYHPYCDLAVRPRGGTSRRPIPSPVRSSLGTTLAAAGGVLARLDSLRPPAPRSTVPMPCC